MRIESKRAPVSYQDYRMLCRRFQAVLSHVEEQLWAEAGAEVPRGGRPGGTA